MQRRVLRIVFPELSYRKSLSVTDLERLDVRRENIVHALFIEITDPHHVLNCLLPPVRNTGVNTRSCYPYELPVIRTCRYSKSFIPHCILKKY